MLHKQQQQQQQQKRRESHDNQKSSIMTTNPTASNQNFDPVTRVNIDKIQKLIDDPGRFSDEEIASFLQDGKNDVETVVNKIFDGSYDFTIVPNKAKKSKEQPKYPENSKRPRRRQDHSDFGRNDQEPQQENRKRFQEGITQTQQSNSRLNPQRSTPTRENRTIEPSSKWVNPPTFVNPVNTQNQNQNPIESTPKSKSVSTESNENNTQNSIPKPTPKSIPLAKVSPRSTIIGKVEKSTTDQKNPVDSKEKTQVKTREETSNAQESMTVLEEKFQAVSLPSKPLNTRNSPPTRPVTLPNGLSEEKEFDYQFGNFVTNPVHASMVSSIPKPSTQVANIPPRKTQISPVAQDPHRSFGQPLDLNKQRLPSQSPLEHEKKIGPTPNNNSMNYGHPFMQYQNNFLDPNLVQNSPVGSLSRTSNNFNDQNQNLASRASGPSSTVNRPVFPSSSPPMNNSAFHAGLPYPVYSNYPFLGPGYIYSQPPNQFASPQASNHQYSIGVMNGVHPSLQASSFGHATDANIHSYGLQNPESSMHHHTDPSQLRANVYPFYESRFPFEPSHSNVTSNGFVQNFGNTPNSNPAHPGLRSPSSAELFYSQFNNPFQQQTFQQRQLS